MLHHYHWKHGWIPLDHYAAISKSKGSEHGARQYLARSHAAGHAHATAVAGTYAGGTHERGLQPVAAEHLKRQRHIVAAFNPDTRRFALHDAEGRVSGNALSGAVREVAPSEVKAGDTWHAAGLKGPKAYKVTKTHPPAGDGTVNVDVTDENGRHLELAIPGHSKVKVSRGGEQRGDVTASIPEHLALHLHNRGHRIVQIQEHSDGQRLLVATPEGGLKSFHASGRDVNQVDPEVKPTPRAERPTTPRAPAPKAKAPYDVGQSVEVQVTDFRAPGQPKVWRKGTVERTAPVEGGLHDVFVIGDDGQRLPTQRVGPRRGNKQIREAGSAPAEPTAPTPPAAPTAPTPPARKPSTPKTPPASVPGGDAYPETHTVEIGHFGNSGHRYGRIKPVSGFRGGDQIKPELVDHLQEHNLKVIGYERRVVTTVDQGGVIRRFKADGSNISKPVIAKPAAGAAALRDIGEWKAISPGDLPGVTGPNTRAIHKITRAYRHPSGHHVEIETKLTEAETEAFLNHVSMAADAARPTLGEHPVTFKVPASDREFRNKGAGRGRTNAYVWRGDTSTVHINPAVARDSSDSGDNYSAQVGHHMSAGKGVHSTPYTITHELGHVHDFLHGRTFEPGTSRTRPEAHSVYSEHRSAGRLSKYGSTKAVEGYAEAFAHHHLAPQSTVPTDHGHDISASDFARAHGWAGVTSWRDASPAQIEQAARSGDTAALREAVRRGLDVGGMLPAVLHGGDFTFG